MDKTIAIYDGVTGTMIQIYTKKNKLEEEEYRGGRFANWSYNTKGNNDQLSTFGPVLKLVCVPNNLWR